jgi:CRISPR-associated protein Cst1
MPDPVVRYCGHPLVDVGAAVLTFMAGKESPEELTIGDLDTAADELLAAYRSEAMRSYLSVLFPNSAYVNPSMGADKRDAFYDAYVRAYRRTDDIGARCVFTGRPAQVRIYRQHLPLITGEGLFNFLPQGEPGLPVGGVALLCIQAMPLGTLRSQGRALLVHSSRNVLTFDFASEFYRANRTQALLEAVAPSGATAKTIVLKKLTEIEHEAQLHARHGQPEGVTVYHFTNYGTNADVDIYLLPAFIVGFLREVQGRDSWKRLVASYWQVGKKGEALGRNYLYEQVFDLPDNAQRFVREFLLGRPRPGRAPGPRAPWELVELFLRKVLDMGDSRIQTIRQIAENLTEHIAEVTGDTRLFARLLRCNDFRELRWLLLRANERNSSAGRELVVDFEQFVEAFGISEDLARPDWRLAWDLTLLRTMELLDARGFLKDEEVRHDLQELTAEQNEPELIGAPEL